MSVGVCWCLFVSVSVCQLVSGSVSADVWWCLLVSVNISASVG